ncbi:TRAP transporter small permease [Roseibium salinum]|uniref:TRAP transporter small permease protein n=1 Tax=Roseibium salinum TaxID=1604349 RepID=A0ABT3QWC8_9HYPH|nr:TRAP transporter small permease [Roseibium sp. DSM 29163]MCX2721216.1 TRAP transporter small permease [Roseibium sp. DSM 29163]MDN3722686.1 TRAP transporter small permease [Roseibium salinum]
MTKSELDSAEASHNIALELALPSAENLAHGYPPRKPGPLVLIQRFLLGICCLSVTALIFIQVFTRYVLHTSIFGIEDLASFVAVWLYFLGGSLGAWERGHISASLVDLIVTSPQRRLWINAAAAFITTALCAWMTKWAFDYFMFTLTRHKMSLELGLPMAYVTVVMPLCLALMTFYFLVEALDLTAMARRATK